MIQFEKVATSHNCNFMRGVGVICTSARTICRKRYKSYHVCKVIVVLHIFHNIFFVSDKQDLLQSKLKVWPLSNFE